MVNTGTGTNSAVLRLGVGTVATDTTDVFIRFIAAATTDTDGTTMGQIQANNNAVAYNTTSDRRLKENIQPTALGLEMLRQIQVRDFNFIADPEKQPRQGFIAQELYNIYPEAVHVGGDDLVTNPWSVEYGRLTPLLVKSIQELNLNLDAVAGTVTPTPSSASETFVTAFFNNLFGKITTWLADAANGIGKIFAEEVYTNKLCVKKSDGIDVCVTGEQLDALLSGSGGSSGGGTPSPTPEPTPEATPSPSGTPIPEATPSPTVEPTPEPTPVPTPAPTP